MSFSELKLTPVTYHETTDSQTSPHSQISHSWVEPIGGMSTSFWRKEFLASFGWKNVIYNL